MQPNNMKDMPNCILALILWFLDFLNSAQSDITRLKDHLKEIHVSSVRLAQFFSEDEKKFKLEECISLFYKFNQAVKKCKQVELKYPSFICDL